MARVAHAPLVTAVANAAATVARFVLLRSWVFHPHRTATNAIKEIRSR